MLRYKDRNSAEHNLSGIFICIPGHCVTSLDGTFYCRNISISRIKIGSIYIYLRNITFDEIEWSNITE